MNYFLSVFLNKNQKAMKGESIISPAESGRTIKAWESLSPVIITPDVHGLFSSEHRKILRKDESVCKGILIITRIYLALSMSLKNTCNNTNPKLNNSLRSFFRYCSPLSLKILVSLIKKLMNSKSYLFPLVS